MPRRFQFSLSRLMVLAALAASLCAVPFAVMADDSLGFMLSALLLFACGWTAIKQTKNPTYTLLGLFALALAWPVWLMLLLAATGD